MAEAVAPVAPSTSAVQRNLVRIESPGNVATTAPANASKNFYARVRLFVAFCVGVAIGFISLSVFAKEFSSPTSLRPSTLATTTDQFLATGADGNPIIKTHLQTTNYVKAAVPTKRMNKTTEMPNKADFVVEEKITKPSIVSKTTALFAKNTTTTSGSGSTIGDSKTTSTTKAPDMRVSTPVGVASIKAPLKPLNISTIISKNNGTLPKAIIPLSTTNPKTLKAVTKAPTAAATKKPLPTKKPVASKKDKNEEEDKDEKDKEEKKSDDKKVEIKKDTDQKYNIEEGHEKVADIGDKDERDKVSTIERKLRTRSNRA